jgi:hypothetical protein
MRYTGDKELKYLPDARYCEALDAINRNWEAVVKDLGLTEDKDAD